MKRIPLSRQIRQEISSLPSQGIKGEENILTELARKGLQHLLQKALEQETTDHLGRGHYKRHQGNELHRGYRMLHLEEIMDCGASWKFDLH
jgi:hypothetical protein